MSEAPWWWLTGSGRSGVGGNTFFGRIRRPSKRCTQNRKHNLGITDRLPLNNRPSLPGVGGPTRRLASPDPRRAAANDGPMQNPLATGKTGESTSPDASPAWASRAAIFPSQREIIARPSMNISEHVPSISKRQRLKPHPGRETKCWNHTAAARVAPPSPGRSSAKTGPHQDPIATAARQPSDSTHNSATAAVSRYSLNLRRCRRRPEFRRGSAGSGRAGGAVVFPPAR